MAEREPGILAIFNDCRAGREAEFEAWFLQFMPKPLLTPDQVRLLQRDNVVSGEAVQEGRTLSGLGVEPHTMASIVPTYLWRFRKTGQFRSRPA